MFDPPDLTRIDLADIDAADQTLAALAGHGLALICGLHDRDAVLRAGTTMMRIRTHRDSDADGVTLIEQRITDPATGSLAGFTDRELHPHTEGSAIDRPAEILMLVCIRPPASGGRTVLVDGAAVYADIAATDPDMLGALTAPRSAFFGDAAGHLGAVFSPRPGGRTAVRLRFDDLIRYGPNTAAYQNKLRDIVRHHEISLTLDSGEGYVLLNDRWLHGRTRFTGNRLALRLLGDFHPGQDITGGFPTSDRSTRLERAR